MDSRTVRAPVAGSPVHGNRAKSVPIFHGSFAPCFAHARSAYEGDRLPHKDADLSCGEWLFSGGDRECVELILDRRVPDSSGAAARGSRSQTFGELHSKVSFRFARSDGLSRGSLAFERALAGC